MVGTRLTRRSVERILDAADTDADGKRCLGDRDFMDVVFAEPVDFSNVRFGEASFRGATFKGEAKFDSACFDQAAEFACATFQGNASFVGAVFRCKPNFEHIERRGDPRDRPGAVRFHRWADFRDATFERGANFGGTQFAERARFAGAIFGTSDVEAGREPLVSFTGARFEQARTLGPLLAFGRLSLDKAIFDGPVRLSLSARNVSCVTSQFLGRTTIEVRYAQLNLEDAEFAEPSIVAGVPERFKRDDARRPENPADLDDSELERLVQGDWKPRVSSLHRTNVDNLAIANADLEECLFSRAYNLDRLRLGESVDIFRQDGRFRTRRLTIHEERQLRGEVQAAPDESSTRRATAEQIARGYRALRKGREDNKNEPGAADFYYGEMEMRRMDARKHARTDARRVEWAILTLYWLVSGYGLRAWRALVAFAVMVALFAWGFQAWGFSPDQGYGKSFLFSLEGTSSFFRGESVVKASTLEPAGRVLQFGVRILGPLLLGLAILALRGRVKR